MAVVVAVVAMVVVVGGTGAGAAGTPRDRTGTEPTSGKGVWPLFHSTRNYTVRTLQCTLFALVLFPRNE